MKLIPAWREALKFWSVRIAIINAALLTFITTFPDAALQAWLALPAEFKTFIPPDYLQVISIVLLFVGMIARIVKQSKVKTEEIQQPQPPTE